MDRVMRTTRQRLPRFHSCVRPIRGNEAISQPRGRHARVPGAARKNRAQSQFAMLAPGQPAYGCSREGLWGRQFGATRPSRLILAPVTGEVRRLRLGAHPEHAAVLERWNRPAAASTMSKVERLSLRGKEANENKPAVSDCLRVHVTKV